MPKSIKRIVLAALVASGIMAAAHMGLVQAANRSPWAVNIDENGGRGGLAVVKVWFDRDASYYEELCRRDSWAGELTRKLGPYRDPSTGAWVMTGSFTCDPR